MVHPDMAFVRIDTWQPAAQGSLPGLRFALLLQLRDVLWGTRVRRLFTLSATILLHIAAFWLAMNARSVVDPISRKPGMTLIDIGNGEAPNNDQGEAADTPMPPTESLPSDVAEWSVTRIKVAVQLSETPPVPSAPARLAPSAASPQVSAASNAAGGATGGGGFDPYAGSAPNWQQSAPAFRAVAQALPCFAFAPAGVTRQLAKIRSKFTLPPFLASMPMRIRLTLDEKGRVAAVEPPMTLTDSASRDRLIHMFNGKKVRAQVPIDANPRCAFVSF